MIGIEHYLILSATVFAIGVAGVLIRKNAIIILMSIELMLNAVNIVFVSFSRFLGTVDGHVIVFFVLTVAAAEAAVGLAVLVAIFRARQTVEVDNLNLMSR